jgi:small subunit ribosomal protein S17
MQERKLETVRNAQVVSKSGDKSVKVEIIFKVKHPKYGKYMRRKSSFMVHDEENQAGIGDKVAVVPCRPLSRSKSWRLVSIVEKASE